MLYDVVKNITSKFKNVHLSAFLKTQTERPMNKKEKPPEIAFEKNIKELIAINIQEISRWIQLHYNVF